MVKVEVYLVNNFYLKDAYTIYFWLLLVKNSQRKLYIISIWPALVTRLGDIDFFSIKNI